MNEYRYLVTLEPLEPYFFGGERTFNFGNVSQRQRKTYFIRSENVPSQTTLFGTLRYLILHLNDALYMSDSLRDLHPENREKAANLVGDESFSYQKEKQQFGIIKGISPLFLYKDGTMFVKTPNNHKKGCETYTPFCMEKMPVTTENGTSLYPSDYSVKDGYGGGYVCLNAKREIISDNHVFGTQVRTGIQAHRGSVQISEVEKKESFFKKEYKYLKKGYAFAFIAHLNAELAEEEKIRTPITVYMGQGKSAFRCTIEKTELCVRHMVQQYLGTGNESHPIVYAASDLKPAGDEFTMPKNTNFCIADTRVIRNLETKSEGSTYYARLAKSQHLYKVINSGAVFYTDAELFNDAHLKMIGMNVMFRLPSKEQE